MYGAFRGISEPADFDRSQFKVEWQDSIPTVAMIERRPTNCQVIILHGAEHAYTLQSTSFEMLLSVRTVMKTRNTRELIRVPYFLAGT